MSRFLRIRRNFSTPMSTFSQGIYFFSALSTVNCHFNHTLQLQSCGQQHVDVPTGTCCQVLRTGRRFRTRRDHIFFSRFINCSIDLTFLPKLFFFIVNPLHLFHVLPNQLNPEISLSSTSKFQFNFPFLRHSSSLSCPAKVQQV